MVHSPSEAEAPGGWGPTGVGGTGLSQGFPEVRLVLTTPTYSTKVPGKLPFSLVRSLVPCSQPFGHFSSPSWKSDVSSAILLTVRRSPGCREISSPLSCLYSNSAQYWKLSELMISYLHEHRWFSVFDACLKLTWM